VGGAHQSDRRGEGAIVDLEPGLVVRHHLDEQRHGVLGTVGDGEPAQGAVPGLERQQHHVMLLAQVRALVGDDSAQLIGIQQAQQPAREHRGGSGTARQAIGDGGGMVDHPGARGVERQRVAEEPDQGVVTSSLTLGPDECGAEVQQQMGGQDYRQAERHDSGQGRTGGQGAVGDVTGQRRQRRHGGRTERDEAEHQQRADHGHTTGKGDGLPERQGEAGRSRRPGRPGEQDRDGPGEDDGQDREGHRGVEHAPLPDSGVDARARVAGGTHSADGPLPSSRARRVAAS
jgi:hypothetical protein